MKLKRTLEVGQTVWEVFIYKVRPAVVTRVCTIRLDDPARTRTTVYEIECEDGSLSPRYYESDVGVALFTDLDEAERKCEENRHYRSCLGPRESYMIKDIERKSRSDHGRAMRAGARTTADRVRGMLRASEICGKKAVRDEI